MLFWVNLARKDKQAEPSARGPAPRAFSVREHGDATVRVLAGEGSPVQLGTPAIVYDVEFPDGDVIPDSNPVEFQGFGYLLDGEASFGANARRATPRSSSLLGPGEELTVTEAARGTRFLLMAGEPDGQTPRSTVLTWTRWRACDHPVGDVVSSPNRSPCSATRRATLSKSNSNP